MNGWYAWRDLRRAGTGRRPDDVVAVAFRHTRLHGGVWASYLAGGVIGAFIALHWDTAGRSPCRSRSSRRSSPSISPETTHEPDDGRRHGGSGSSGEGQVPVARPADHCPTSVSLRAA